MSMKYFFIVVCLNLLIAHQGCTMNKGDYCEFITKDHSVEMYEKAVSETTEKFAEYLKKYNQHNCACNKCYGSSDKLGVNDSLELYKRRIIKLMPSSLEKDKRFSEFRAEYRYALLKEKLLELRQRQLFGVSAHNFKEINEWIDGYTEPRK